VEGPLAESFQIPDGCTKAPFKPDRAARLPHLPARPGNGRKSSGNSKPPGARSATPDDARLVRIENGKPRYGEDIRETSLPQGKRSRCMP